MTFVSNLVPWMLYHVRMKYFLLSTIIFVFPLTAAAQYDTLVEIPQLQGGGFNDYINAVYALCISVAALLAVVKIIVAGVKYMFSDIVPQKNGAKKDIQGALLGLVIVLAAVLILTVINPNLTNFDLNITQQDRAPEQKTSSNTRITTERGKDSNRY